MIQSVEVKTIFVGIYEKERDCGEGKRILSRSAQKDLHLHVHSNLRVNED